MQTAVASNMPALAPSRRGVFRWADPFRPGPMSSTAIQSLPTTAPGCARCWMVAGEGSGSAPPLAAAAGWSAAAGRPSGPWGQPTGCRGRRGSGAWRSV